LNFGLFTDSSRFGGFSQQLGHITDANEESKISDEVKTGHYKIRLSEPALHGLDFATADAPLDSHYQWFGNFF
jgi:hypothetical protein